MALAKERSSEKKRKFTLYAYKPMWCEVEATSKEEAEEIALERGNWEWEADENLEARDIYGVVDDEEEGGADSLEK